MVGSVNTPSFKCIHSKVLKNNKISLLKNAPFAYQDYMHG